LVGLAGFLFLESQLATVTLGDALVIVPVATATAFLPFTVGGAGAREAAFIVLCGTALGMNASSATAASLMLWGSQLTVAAVGGLLQLLYPLSTETASE
jgi:hypothetical protein